ncbi:lytic transglycosylase catalytic [Roseibium sp. TrichSKD4]|nr:lytic transglycosylase catalytic [Roseibium sp. TrichSKD4]
MTIVLLISTNAALSQNTNGTGFFPSNYSTFHIYSDERIATIIASSKTEARISRSEFAPGADEIVTEASSHLSARNAFRGTQFIAMQFDSLSNMYFTAPSPVTEKFKHAQRLSSPTSFEIEPKNSRTTSPAAECGPSPLSSDEIKTLVAASAHKHGVDTSFALAIAWAESRFDEARNSPKGARGPMQLIPATAARFGVKDICDPAQNIEGGMKYLRVLFDEFQNPLLVAAAYNSGEGRIYEHGGIPPFHETVGYVARVVNYQLGLPMPAPKAKPRAVNKAPAPAKAQSPARKPKHDAGVIAVQKTGTFVGGVMHF